MRRDIKPYQFWVSIIIGFFNTIFFLLFLLKFETKHFFFLTMWTYWLNSIYLLVVCICDISLCCFKSTRLEKINDFFRNDYSLVSFPFSYAVTFLFWFLVCLGNNVMNFDFVMSKMIARIYLHGINTGFLLLDLFISEHKKKEFDWNVFTAISTIFWVYCTDVCIGKYWLNIMPYRFVENINSIFLLFSIGILFYLVVLIAYQFHLYLINRIGKNADDYAELQEKEEMYERLI